MKRLFKVSLVIIGVVCICLNIYAKSFYFNESAGYLIFARDTLYMYAPVQNDSTSFYCASTCKYQLCDSNHIELQSYNSAPNYRRDSISITPSTEAHHTSDRIVTFKVADYSCEFEISVTINQTSRYPISQTIATINGLATMVLESYAKDITLRLRPINFIYIPSNTDLGYYGLMAFNYPTINVTDLTNDIYITLFGLSASSLRQYYIPGSYMEISSDRSKISWRGNIYEKILPGNSILKQ